MAKLSTEDLLGQFKEMTLVELSDFVKAFETEFDVTAAAPVAVMAAGGGAAGGEAAAAQDEFTVIIEDAGSQKIAVIKEVRALNSSLGLKEAKDLVDATPATVLEKADKATADKAKAALEAAGASRLRSKRLKGPSLYRGAFSISPFYHGLDIGVSRALS